MIFDIKIIKANQNNVINLSAKQIVANFLDKLALICKWYRKIKSRAFSFFSCKPNASSQ